MSYGTVQAEKMTTESGYSLGAGNASSFKNRIINGAMVIDQRNAGASVTPALGANTYTLDRWFGSVTQASKLTVQQNAGSVTPPSGFTNYLGVVSSSSYSVTGDDFFQVAQIIEGFNIADLNWGTASAKPATLSFWVRSSLTGTFGGSIATTKTAVWVMPFTYTISSANTWTYITVAIPAATSTGGTNNNNSEGIYFRFGLGASGIYSGGTPGTWTNSGNFIQPAGTVSVVGTNGATWQITGVQFEVGTVATSFDFRSYGTELALCQRYLYSANNVGSVSNYQPFFPGVVANTTQNGVITLFPQVMRAQPSASFTGAIRLTDMVNWSVSVSTLDSSYLGASGGLLYCNTVGNVITTSGGVGRGLYLGADGATARVLFSAEL